VQDWAVHWAGAVVALTPLAFAAISGRIEGTTEEVPAPPARQRTQRTLELHGGVGCVRE